MKSPIWKDLYSNGNQLYWNGNIHMSFLMATLFLWSWLFAKVNHWLNSGMDRFAVTLWVWWPWFCQNIFKKAIVRLFTSKQSALCKFDIHKLPLGGYFLATRVAESTVFLFNLFFTSFYYLQFHSCLLISSLPSHWSTYNWQVSPLDLLIISWTEK